MMPRRAKELLPTERSNAHAAPEPCQKAAAIDDGAIAHYILAAHANFRY